MGPPNRQARPRSTRTGSRYREALSTLTSMNPVGTVDGVPTLPPWSDGLAGFPDPLDEGEVDDRGRVAEPSLPSLSSPNNELSSSVDPPVDESPDVPATVAGAAVVAVVVVGVVVVVGGDGDASRSVLMSASAAVYRLSDKGA